MRSAAELLAHRASVLADWADRMPLRDVYIFGDPVGEDAAADAKLSVAIEYSSDVSDEMLRSWQRENSTGFAELRDTALGIAIALYSDQDYDVWPAISDAVRSSADDDTQSEGRANACSCCAPVGR